MIRGPSPATLDHFHIPMIEYCSSQQHIRLNRQRPTALSPNQCGGGTVVKAPRARRIIRYAMFLLTLEKNPPHPSRHQDHTALSTESNLGTAHEPPALSPTPAPHSSFGVVATTRKQPMMMRHRKRAISPQPPSSFIRPPPPPPRKSSNTTVNMRSVEVLAHTHNTTSKQWW